MTIKTEFYIDTYMVTKLRAGCPASKLPMSGIYHRDSPERPIAYCECESDSLAVVAAINRERRLQPT